MDDNCDYNLDLKSEAKDIETISVLCLDYVPEKFHLFVINYIIRQMVSLIESNKIPKKNIMFVREAATFFRATEDSVLEDKFKIFRTYMSHYIRMGRRGTYFALDCQSSAEVKGLVQGSSDYLLMFKTTSWRDKQDMTDEFKREKRMRQDQVVELAFLEKGECFIAETGGRTVKKVKITLPRNAYWKKEYGNFYKNMWEKYGGEWKNTNKTKEYINSLVDAVIRRYKNLEESEKQKRAEEKAIQDMKNIVNIKKTENVEELSPEQKVGEQEAKYEMPTPI